ncbi:hypothetical protein [Bdellovibrio sp.]|uniref:hypothetical protein n=1 Tax=Bdellovibrio sp. TaxID=28201 RepID=UPI0039E22175
MLQSLLGGIFLAFLLVGCTHTSKPSPPSEAMLIYQTEGHEVDLNFQGFQAMPSEFQNAGPSSANDTYENEFGVFQKKRDPTFGHTIQRLKTPKAGGNKKQAAEIIWY